MHPTTSLGSLYSAIAAGHGKMLICFPRELSGVLSVDVVDCLEVFPRATMHMLQLPTVEATTATTIADHRHHR